MADVWNILRKLAPCAVLFGGYELGCTDPPASSFRAMETGPTEPGAFASQIESPPQSEVAPPGTREPGLQAQSEAAGDPLCPDTVEGLPSWSGLFDSDDPRLRGHSLVVVRKKERRLMLYSEGELVQDKGARQCWRIALAQHGRLGDKRRQGDRRTPEGWYETSDKLHSKFYHAIAIHYPNEADGQRGLAAGTIDIGAYRQIVEAIHAGRKPPQRTGLGGEILIHGGGSRVDWTLGCIGMTDADIDLLRARLPAGMRTNILILP